MRTLNVKRTSGQIEQIARATDEETLTFGLLAEPVIARNNKRFGKMKILIIQSHEIEKVRSSVLALKKLLKVKAAQ
jgi:hypothetical protein